MIRFLSHPSHPYGGQRVLFLLISRVVISIINKTLSMPNKMCVLTSWFAGDISGNYAFFYAALFNYDETEFYIVTQKFMEASYLD